MIRCEHCQKQLDSDFIEFEEYNDQEVCIDCYNEMQGDEEPDYDVENYFEERARDLEKFN